MATTDIIECEGGFIGNCWLDEDGNLYVTFPFSTQWVPVEDVNDFVYDLKRLLAGLEAFYILQAR
jgi:hypothetical protein